MHVTLVSRIFAPEPGAAPLRLAALVRAMAHRGAAVRVVTATPPAGLSDDVDCDGVEVRRARVKRNRDGYVRGYLSYLSFDVPLVFRLLFSKRPAAYVVEPPPTTGLAVRLVAAVQRRPYVYYAADVWSDAAGAVASDTITRTLRRVERWAMNGAALVVAVSDEVAERVRDIGVEAPLIVSGFGVDTDVFRVVPGIGLDEQSALFVYPGMYAERHGAEVFAEALGLLLDELPGSAHLIFCGTGTEEEAIRAACPKRHRKAITFQPPIAPEEVAALLNAATAGLASVKPDQGYDYAFATKTIAVMAAGCPVIYAGPGPAGDVVREASARHSVCAAVEFDAKAVAEAMRRAVTQRSEHALRAALSTWVHERHSAAAVADGVARAVFDVVRNRA